MPDIAKAYVQIIPSAEGIKGKLQNAISGEAESAGNAGGQTMGSSLVGKIKGVIAAAGIGSAIKKAVTVGADLEQSIGGIETLFKKSADTVVKNADNAWKTAGLSANSYMEQVTSFSASLLSSLGGDTKKAASAADQAITDMADNSNKMGTSIESIQNAYQGFAKQNYTMLDNLKLGYGGTKSEMERLLSDAEKLSGQKYDISNLSDVYQAIHVIQDELNITGTTAKEADTTISGSTEAMKAAFENVLGNMALGRDELGSSLTGLGQSIKTFVGGNLAPAISNIATSLPTVFKAALAGLSELKTIGIEMIGNVSSGLAEGIPSLLEQVLPMVVSLSESLRANASQLIDSGMNLILQLAQGIANSIPTLVTYIPTIVTNIAGIINDNAPKILTTGVKVIITLVKGIIQAIPTIVANIPKIVLAIVSVIQAFNWIGLGKQIINAFKNGIIALKGAVSGAGKNIFNAVVNAIKALPSKLLGLAKNGISSFRGALAGGAGVLKAAATTILNGILNVIKSLPGKLASFATRAVSGFKSKFTSVNWSSIGTNIISGIVHGITGAAGRIGSALMNAAKGAFNKAKSFLKIGSPSKKAEDEIGKMIPAGVAVGIRKNDAPVKAMRNLTDDLMDTSKMKLYTPASNKNITYNQMRMLIGDLISRLDKNEEKIFQAVTRALNNLGIKWDRREIARIIAEVSG